MSPYEPPGNTTLPEPKDASSPMSNGNPKSNAVFFPLVWDYSLAILLTFFYFELFPEMKREVFHLFSNTDVDFFVLRDVLHILFMYSLPAMFLALFSMHMLRPRGNGTRMVYVSAIVIQGILGAQPNQLADGTLSFLHPVLGFQTALMMTMIFLPMIGWRCGWITILSYLSRFATRLIVNSMSTT